MLKNIKGENALNQKTHHLLITIGFACIMLALTALLFQKTALADEKEGHGKFFLVSVGVGDPDLVTVRALETIRQSDIIICVPRLRLKFQDQMEEKTFWEGAFNEWQTYGKDCALIDDRAQREKCENDRLVRKNLEERIRSAIHDGKTVSVLGSGDLSIYPGPNRWYQEEMSDILHEIIPGVSSFNAANANIGRDLMGSRHTNFAVLTDYGSIDKASVHNPALVIFTMNAAFEDLVNKLKTHYPVETPIAIVFYAGYRGKEYRISGRLDNILKKTEGIDFPFEHLVYVGDFME